MKQYLDKIIFVKPWVMFISVFVVSLIDKTFFGIFLWVIWCLLFTYWTLRVGEELFNRLEDKSILNLNRFRYQILFAVSYILFVVIFFGGYSINANNYDEYDSIIWIIIPMHIILMFCIIHTIYFLSKCITTLRNKNEEYVWYMLRFWFFPIGIWIIQPRIIELLKDSVNSENSTE
tara:strand:+ start:71 stop:598 length:528 start_codon:yes stop_codon:yes gene_type:complete